MKKIISILAALILAFSFSLGCAKKSDAFVNPAQKTILQVDRMPDRASNYKLIDYKAKAQEVDNVLYAFAKKTENDPYNSATMGPIGYWDDTKTNINERSFGFPSYIAGPTAGVEGAQEGIAVLASLWASSAIGIDKSSQSFGNNENYNFIKMAKAFYNKSPNEFVLNNINGKTGRTFWYEIYPQIQFIRLHQMYPNETWMKEIIVTGAEKWHGALPNFKDNVGKVSFEFVSYDFSTNKPVIGATWNEPPNGGLAMIFYYAYLLTGEEKYLQDVKYVLDYLENWEKNSYYEILQDYASYVAAVMNARHGTHYDVQKFVNVGFEGSTEYRSSSQVVNSKWGDYDAYGLMAFAYTPNSGSGYAFAMNTWHMAVTLANTIRYDPRFADDIGKWFMHMANSSRIFFGDEIPLENQSCPTAAQSDPTKAIAYEGVKSSYNNQTPYAMGDQTTMGWGGDTDYGIYGGAHVGLLASMIEKTNVEEILRVDLSHLDTLKQNDNAYYMYYNPYNKKKSVKMHLNSAAKLYNTVTNKVIAESVNGDIDIIIPALSSIVVAVLPVDSKITEENGNIFANGAQISNCKPSVNILTPDEPKKTLTKSTEFTFSMMNRENDKIKKMKVTLGGKVLYEGTPINKVGLGNAVIKKGVHNLIVEIETEKGLSDIAMLRVRKL